MNDRSHSSCIWLLATSSFSLDIGFISLQLPDQMAFVPSYNLCTQIHISHLHSACGSNCVWNQSCSHWFQWQIARIDLNGSRIGAHSAVVSSHVTSILVDPLDVELHALKCQVLEASWEAVYLATHVSVGISCAFVLYHDFVLDFFCCCCWYLQDKNGLATALLIVYLDNACNLPVSTEVTSSLYF